MKSDKAVIKDGIITNAITMRNGNSAHFFAFVYPILKNRGICIPVITEKIKNDKPNPSITSDVLTLILRYSENPKCNTITAKNDTR